ncbi:acyl-CoA carboxylase epsilon subunit [Kitasatospora sp. NPDC058965]|uniref:acyl-CoA carboxylase epsilon subunit n=1 Tax=Kitasatospora sp. NPDC058965 TaxID=3346682 RepID=UPI0036CD977C
MVRLDVLRGSLTDDELAAVSAVLLTRAAATARPHPAPARRRPARWQRGGRPARPEAARRPASWAGLPY